MPLFISASAYRHLLDRLHKLETEKERRAVEHDQQMLDLARVQNRLRMALSRAEQRAPEPAGPTNGTGHLSESAYKFGRR